MGKSKLEKFAELETFENVFERDGKMKGKWKSDFFKNDGKLTIELACGKGEYTRGLAKIFPNENFIGMDIKGNRIWTARDCAQKEELNNVAFIRDQIDLIEDYFELEELDEIWITFSDPFLKPGKSRNRLTSSRFIPHYQKVLKKGGLVHLKTDNDVLYNYTLNEIKENNFTIIHNHNDIYGQKVTHLTHDIQTYYEHKHLKNGLTIKYICFKIH